MRQPERELFKQVLLDQVWGTDFFGDANIVEVYVKPLRQKLEALVEPRLIQILRGKSPIGYAPGSRLHFYSPES
ncbi:winged helix-turn-helix transcriptional regulator [Meiothermus sp. CFH 77666]|nr:winged helix-turn-helix transcriptional regulator [Meiothermus sp. CFH 77666]